MNKKAKIFFISKVVENLDSMISLPSKTEKENTINPTRNLKYELSLILKII